MDPIEVSPIPPSYKDETVPVSETEYFLNLKTPGDGQTKRITAAASKKILDKYPEAMGRYRKMLRL
jgi:hypothetical protein